MQTRQVVVGNPHGLHLRVASRVVKLVQSHGARVRLVGGDEREADARSVLDLLTLGANRGESLRVEAEGPDEVQVADRLEDLLSDGAGI